MPRGTLLAALFATACGENIVTFELPPLEGARSAIFAFHGPDSFEARAVDLDDAIAVSFPVDLDPDAEGKIEALGFAASLGELGLSSGRIDIIDEGKPLRQHDQLFVLDFRGDEGSWVEGTERSEEVDAVKIPFDRDCTVLEVVESFPIESRSDHAFMLSLGEERALIAQTDGAMYVIEPSGPSQVTDIQLPRPLTDVLRLEDGTLLFSGTLGRVFSGRIGTSTSASPIRIEGDVLTAIPSGGRIIHLTGGRAAGLLELFALTQDGVVHRYDGSSWREVHRFGLDVNTASAVVRPRPGLAYASTDEKAEVIRYRDGALDDASPPDLMNGIPSMKDLPEIGLVASRSEGGLYLLRDGEEWELLGGSPISLNVYSFQWLESSFLFAGTVGLVSEYRLSDGYCPAVTLGGGAIRDMIPFGDGFLFGEDKPPSRDRVQATIVRIVR